MNDMRWTDPGAAAPASEPVSSCVDAAEFRDRYRQTLPYVYGYLLHRVGGDRAVAEDLTQETYLAAVQEMRRIDAVTALSAPWLIGIARHKLVDHFRRVAREERKLALVSDQASEGAGWQWPDMPVDEILATLGSLPALQRAAIALRYLDDLPVPEVAGFLGRSVHATESLLARGRDRLRRRYAEQSDD